jgi:protein disulfide-isomerase A1
MKSFQNLALGLLGAAAVASAADAPSDVFDLKSDTFPEFIKENPLVLAECEYSAPPTCLFLALLKWTNIC